MAAPVTFGPTPVITQSILRPRIRRSPMWSSQRWSLLMSRTWLSSWVKMEVSCVIGEIILLRLSNLWCCLGPWRKGRSETSRFLMLRNRTARALPSWPFFRHNTFARSKLLLSLILQSIAQSVSAGLVPSHISKLLLLHRDLSLQLLMSSLDPGLCISIWAGPHSLRSLGLKNSELFLLGGTWTTRASQRAAAYVLSWIFFARIRAWLVAPPSEWILLSCTLLPS